jgi:hypothetical protein
MKGQKKQADNEELVCIVTPEELKERFYPKGTWRRFTYDIGFFLFRLKAFIWYMIKKK